MSNTAAGGYSAAGATNDARDSERVAPRPAADEAPSMPTQTAGQFTGMAQPTVGMETAADATDADERMAAKSETSSQTRHHEGDDGTKKKKGDASSDEESVDIDEAELSHLPPEYREAVLRQVFTPKRKPVTFFELWKYATKLEILFDLLGILTSVVAGVLQPLMTVFFGNLTNSLVNYQAVKNTSSNQALIDQARAVVINQVNKNVLNLVYIAIGVFAATWIYMAAFVYSGEQITRRVRERYLKSVLRQNVAYFDKMGAGEVTTRIQSDMHLIQEGISDKVPMTTMYLGTFFGGFVIAIVRNWRLALVVSTIIPVIAMTGGFLNKFVSSYRTRSLSETSKAGTLAEEVISSVRNAHAFSTQQKLVAMYDKPNAEAQNLGGRSAIANSAGLGVIFFVIYSAYALAFYYGTTLILQGRADAGQVINVFFSIMIGAFSLAMMAPNLQAFSYARGAANEIYRTIERVPPIDSSSPDGLKPEHLEGVLSFDHVDFVYPARPSVQVLYSFTAVFPRGQTTALVGASGSGKSTCIGLIERFYDPVAGKVMLDGVEMKDLNLRWLRSHIGLVSQEPTLFATTVAGNIEHGLIGTKYEDESPEQKRERVINAAKMANADGFITALPEGYDTMIGERGMLLSGGQRQRISIARAIVSDPEILLLDEATSALDTTSEAIVQDALDRASEGRTTVTIAHRLSTIKNAHQIIVMSEGRQLESAMSAGGKRAHDILLENPDGAYSKLVSAQKLREQQDKEAAQADESDEEANAEPQELDEKALRAQAENEKPMFEQLKRTGTGRSAASEALSAKHRADVEAGRVDPKEHSFPYLFLRMLRINRDQAWLYVVGFAASVGVGAVYPVFAIVYGGMIGAFSKTGSELRSAGDRYALYSFIIALVATCFVMVQQWSFGTSVERLSRKLRLLVFQAILRQDIAYFDKEENSTGHLTSSVAEWAQKVNGLLGVTSGTIIQSLFTLIIGAIIGLAYAWRIALVGIACIPLTMSAGIVRLRVVVLKDKKNKKSHEASAQMACEAAAAIRTVAALTREDDCCAIYSKQLDEPARQSNRTALVANSFYSLSQALTFLVIALIFWYGAHQLVDGNVESRTFFVAMIAIIFGSIQAGNVFNYVPDMSSARGAAAEIVKLLDSRPEIDAQEPSGDIVPESAVRGHIKFDNVHFRYPTRPHVRVLRGLNIEVKPGQFVALVGPSGCGKSTLIQLVERFYDPLSGTVSLDGYDVSRLNINEYRKYIALVSQEPTLYAGTVRFNITLGATRPENEITQEEVERACRDANIHNFIMTLPDGYDTEVGGKGTQLSGGQRQRIAIARALIRNPKVLLLDEATSALDSESEKVVQKALDEAAKGRTTIAVAHRLSTIQSADVIYVLKDGRVYEQGNHWELIAKKGAYYELIQQQSLQKH